MQQKPSIKRTLRPRVGLGVIITKGNQVLLVKRKHSHGHGTWSVPGGHLEYGELLEVCATREVQEEVGVTITDLAFRAVTNDLFEAERLHYVTIWMEGRYFSGEAGIHAQGELSDVGWFSWDILPEPLFLPLQHLLMGQCYPAPWNFNE